MEHPKRVGDRTTLAVMLALHESGYSVSVPFGENTRYDLIVDDGDERLRIQCKSGRLRQGAVRFATCSCYGHHRSPGETRRDYLEQVDGFAVYCAELGSVYLLRMADIGTRVEGALRVEPARNGQRRRVRLAADYEIGGVLVTAAGSRTEGGEA